MIYLMIALGGALGALARFSSGKALWLIFGASTPAATLFVNVLGSFLMGLFVGLSTSKMPISEELRGFLLIGFLGSFTTFSTFSMDAVRLIQQDQWSLAMAYITANVILCVGGCMGALLLSSKI